jgi:hypothetical protein
MSDDDRRSPQRVRRTALWLAALALVVYLGFIFLNAIRG